MIFLNKRQIKYNMAAHNHIFRRGDDYAIKMNIAGATLDLEGFIYTLTMKLDYEQESPDLQVSYTVNADDITNEYFYINLPASETATLEPADYYWDLQQRQISNSGGADTVQTIAPDLDLWKTDRIKVLPDITLNNN